MIKLMKSEEERKEEKISLEDVGLEMTKLIGLSFFDDEAFTGKVFEKCSQSSLDQDHILLNKFIMHGRSSQEKIFKKYFFIISQIGIYKLSEKKQHIEYKFMPFEKTRMVISENSEKHSAKNFLYGFHFFRLQNTYHICVEEEELFTTLRDIFIYKTIQHTFHQEFDVQKLIGKGSFAKVYYAIKRKTQIEFAIKAFSKEGLSSQSNGRDGLLNEIEIMRCVNHKNILKLYEIYETEHSIYLVVDLLSGGELITKVQTAQNHLTFFDIGMIIKNLLEAVDHLHKHGIMHRDIKPENLLLQNSSHVYDIVLADFGLATKIKKPVEEILFKRCGTPGFVAPEILSYKEGKSQFYNEKCDIFSVGALFYLLLTGKKLFKGDNCVDVLKENKACEIDFESDELEGVPEIAIDLLVQLLCTVPECRVSANKAISHKYFETYFAPNSSEKHSMKIDLKKHANQISDYKQFSPVSPHKQGMSPIVMRKNILTGKVDTMEKVEGANISPKKGGNLLGKMNLGGFSDFTEDVVNNKISTPKNSKLGKNAVAELENKKVSSPFMKTKSPKK